MIVSMKLHATRDQIDAVCERIRDFNYKIHSIEGEERVVIGVVGVGDVTACLESVEAMPGVEKAVRISAPYKFVSREFRQGRTLIRVKSHDIGGDEFTVMAGPCSVESEKQIMDTAEAVAEAGAHVLRGGAFKPRTSPYDFQGMEEEGLRLLRQAGERTRMAVVTEVMSDSDVELIAEYADIMQVGARNMQNFALLKALGRCARPVLLKRGMSSTVKELLMSAEYIVAHGNPNVILCERGIRTFETVTRNTCDIAAIAGLERVDASARGARSEPRHRQAQPGAGPQPRRGGDRRRRPDRRGAPVPGQGGERRRPVARHPDVPRHDAGSGTAHRIVEEDARGGDRGGTGVGWP